ncbi:hypothetical protein [Spirosoma gilvum]
MFSCTNLYLLKQYIKTLVAAELDFPDVLPRHFGDEFSRSELQAIYFSLSFIIKQAHPKTNKLLITEFNELDESVLYLHWFLCDFWRELVPLIHTHTSQVERYSLVLN